MIISTRGRYALRVMIDLAEHPADGYVPLQDIADRQQISKEYLNSILKVLVQGNQLESLRGKGGGYRLNQPPENYSVGTILRLAEGDLAPVACVQEGKCCPSAPSCRTHIMWNELNHEINSFLDHIHLSDFLENGRFYIKANASSGTEL